jgi:hypothetical protein
MLEYMIMCVCYVILSNLYLHHTVYAEYQCCLGGRLDSVRAVVCLVLCYCIGSVVGMGILLCEAVGAEVKRVRGGWVCIGNWIDLSQWTCF